MGNVALVIVFNHQYNKNIEVLEQIYKDRFKHIYHLVPFYRGTKENVIPVYSNSYYFQGYLAQGLKSYYKLDYEHYFFIGDDLILNPSINENNYKELLKINKGGSFIPNFFSLHKNEVPAHGYWWPIKHAFEYNIEVKGLEAKNQLPSVDEAKEAFKKHNFEIKPLKYHQIWGPPLPPIQQRFLSFKYITSRLFYNLKKFLFSYKKYNLSYPLIGGWADILVVSSEVIERFCHNCGVFAAANLFVEIALPTALVLSTTDIVTELETELKGGYLWTVEDLKMLDKYSNSLTKLFTDFPKDRLFIHPIKLSKWKFES